jgi:hypothetical protein
VSATGNYRALRIFVACPGDVTPEKERLSKIVERLQEPAHGVGFFLELKEWRQVTPDMGRPQEIIFEQMAPRSWDIFVGILWMRFGAPSGATHPITLQPFESGTYEEFVVAHNFWKASGRPRILFYRCNRPPKTLDQIEPAQYTKVADFFREFETGGRHPGIYKAYYSVEDFYELAFDDLGKLIRSAPTGDAKQLAQELSAASENLPTDLIPAPPNSAASKYIRSGFDYYYSQDLKGALLDFTKAISVDPTCAKAYVYRGVVRHYMLDAELAIRDFTEAIRLEPKYSIAYSSRGTTHSARQDYHEALSDLTEAIRLEPKNHYAYFERSRIYEKKRMYWRAAFDWIRALIYVIVGGFTWRS